jgi:hypothetical protein
MVIASYPSFSTLVNFHLIQSECLLRTIWENHIIFELWVIRLDHLDDEMLLPDSRGPLDNLSNAIEKLDI